MSLLPPACHAHFCASLPSAAVSLTRCALSCSLPPAPPARGPRSFFGRLFGKKVLEPEQEDTAEKGSSVAATLHDPAARATAARYQQGRGGGIPPLPGGPGQARLAAPASGGSSSQPAREDGSGPGPGRTSSLGSAQEAAGQVSLLGSTRVRKWEGEGQS